MPLRFGSVKQMEETMKKALYLSLVAMMLANVDVQNAYGSRETYEKSAIDPQSQRFQEALSNLNDSCKQHKPSLAETLDSSLRVVYDKLPSDRRDEFIDLLEHANKASNAAWVEIFSDFFSSNTNYSPDDIALLSLRMFTGFEKSNWTFFHNASLLSVLSPIIQLRASIAPSEGFPLSFVSLRFTGNDLGDAGIAQISPLLKANCILDLSINGDDSITINGWRTFAQALQQNCSLTHLYLDHCNIGDAETTVIAESLARNNCSLELLSLSLNSIGNAGANAIADSLKVNNSITSLNLSSNPINETGAQAIFDVINSGQNITLTSVRLPDN